MMTPRSFNRRALLRAAIGAAGCSLAEARPASARLARQAAGYVITDLGGFGRASGINTDGQCVGLSGSTAAMWDRQGQPIDLGAWPGDASSEAFAINDAGVIVGASWSSAYQAHAVVWTQGQVFDLGMLEGGAESMALAINGANQVVGWSTAADGTAHAVRWDLSQGVIDDLGTILSDAHAEATGINDGGIIAGWAQGPDGTPHGFRLDGDSITDLGSSSLAFGINADGHVAGTAQASDGNDHAVLWMPDQVVYFGDDGIASRAAAINDAGVVVGARAPGGPELAVLWDESGQETELAGLEGIDPSIDATAAYGINADGLIVGESGGIPVRWEPI